MCNMYIATRKEIVCVSRQKYLMNRASVSAELIRDSSILKLNTYTVTYSMLNLHIPKSSLEQLTGAAFFSIALLVSVSAIHTAIIVIPTSNLRQFQVVQSLRIPTKYI